MELMYFLWFNHAALILFHTLPEALCSQGEFQSFPWFVDVTTWSDRSLESNLSPLSYCGWNSSDLPSISTQGQFHSSTSLLESASLESEECYVPVSQTTHNKYLNFAENATCDILGIQACIGDAALSDIISMAISSDVCKSAFEMLKCVKSKLTTCDHDIQEFAYQAIMLQLEEINNICDISTVIWMIYNEWNQSIAMPLSEETMPVDDGSCLLPEASACFMQTDSINICSSYQSVIDCVYQCTKGCSSIDAVPVLFELKCHLEDVLGGCDFNIPGYRVDPLSYLSKCAMEFAWQLDHEMAVINLQGSLLNTVCTNMATYLRCVHGLQITSDVERHYMDNIVQSVLDMVHICDMTQDQTLHTDVVQCHHCQGSYDMDTCDNHPPQMCTANQVCVTVLELDPVNDITMVTKGCADILWCQLQHGCDQSGMTCTMCCHGNMCNVMDAAVPGSWMSWPGVTESDSCCLDHFSMVTVVHILQLMNYKHMSFSERNMLCTSNGDWLASILKDLDPSCSAVVIEQVQTVLYLLLDWTHTVCNSEPVNEKTCTEAQQCIRKLGNPMNQNQNSNCRIVGETVDCLYSHYQYCNDEEKLEIDKTVVLLADIEFALCKPDKLLEYPEPICVNETVTNKAKSTCNETKVMECAVAMHRASVNPFLQRSEFCRIAKVGLACIQDNLYKCPAMANSHVFTKLMQETKIECPDIWCPSPNTCNLEAAHKCLVNVERELPLPIDQTNITKDSCISYHRVYEEVLQCLHESIGSCTNHGTLCLQTLAKLVLNGSNYHFCSVMPKFQISEHNNSVDLVEGEDGYNLTVALTSAEDSCHGGNQCMVEVSVVMNGSHAASCLSGKMEDKVVLSRCTWLFGKNDTGISHSYVFFPRVDHRVEHYHNVTVMLVARLLQDGTLVNESILTTLTMDIVDRDTTGLCLVVSEPAVRTFDGLYFYNFNQGEYTLYQHAYYQEKVNIVFQSCTPGSLTPCPCAVMTQSSDDVFVIDKCRRRGEVVSPTLKFKVYRNHNLDTYTKVYADSSRTSFQFILPSGAVIYVKSATYLLHVWIKPSAMDYGRTSGLCGKYDGVVSNDLTLLSGEIIDPQNVSVWQKIIIPTVFISSWRANSSLLNGVAASNSIRLDDREKCQCKNDVCTPTDLVEICDFISGVDISNDLDIYVQNMSVVTRAKQQTDDIDISTGPTNELPSWSSNWIEATAYINCVNMLQNNALWNICQDLVNTVQLIQICATQFLLSDPTNLTLDSLEEFKISCQVIIKTNSSIAASKNMTQNELVTKILSLLCLENCNDQENCFNTSACTTTSSSVTPTTMVNFNYTTDGASHSTSFSPTSSSNISTSTTPSTNISSSTSSNNTNPSISTSAPTSSISPSYKTTNATITVSSSTNSSIPLSSAATNAILVTNTSTTSPSTSAVTKTFTTSAITHNSTLLTKTTSAVTAGSKSYTNTTAPTNNASHVTDSVTSSVGTTSLTNTSNTGSSISPTKTSRISTSVITPATNQTIQSSGNSTSQQGADASGSLSETQKVAIIITVSASVAVLLIVGLACLGVRLLRRSNSPLETSQKGETNSALNVEEPSDSVVIQSQIKNASYSEGFAKDFHEEVLEGQEDYSMVMFEEEVPSAGIRRPIADYGTAQSRYSIPQPSFDPEGYQQTQNSQTIYDNSENLGHPNKQLPINVLVIEGVVQNSENFPEETYL